MTSKISTYLCYAFPPALFEWVVIEHAALCLQCSCIGYLQNNSQDAPRNSNGSERDAQSTPNICVIPLHCVRQPQETVFRSFSLFFCEKTRNDLAAQKHEVCSYICNREWILQLLVDGYILNFFIDNHSKIFSHAWFAFGLKKIKITIGVLEILFENCKVDSFNSWFI